MQAAVAAAAAAHAADAAAPFDRETVEASFPDDERIGLEFAEMRHAATGTLHISIAKDGVVKGGVAERRYPQLVRRVSPFRSAVGSLIVIAAARAQRPGLILQQVNGEPQGDRPWDETAAMLRTTDKGGVRPLHLTFVPPTLESLQTAVIGVNRARRKFNQLLSPQSTTRAAPQAQLQPEPELQPSQQPPQGDAYGGSDAGTAEPLLQRTPLRTPTAEPELAASPLPAASVAASPAVRQTVQTMSARLDRARQQAEQEDAELHKQLRQVELEMSRMSLLAEPEATDPLELLASPAAGAYGGASASAAGGVIAQVRHRLSRIMLNIGGEPD